MFNNFKEKMNNFYENIKKRVNSPDKKEAPHSESKRIQRKRENRRMDNSLHMGKLNQTDLDLRKLDEFQMEQSFSDSRIVSGDRRVHYYDPKFKGLMDSQKKTFIRRDTGSSRRSDDSGFLETNKGRQSELPANVTSNFRKSSNKGLILFLMRCFY